jgi:hypothetical protein
MIALLKQEQVFRYFNFPEFLSLQLENLASLRSFLSGATSDDFYTVSPAYYAMTGRKGLWLYGDEERCMIVARHPNLPHTVLFFPPIGPDRVSLIESALRHLFLPEGCVHLARLSDKDKDVIGFYEEKGLKAEREAVLDWAYPAYTLNTEAVLLHKGADFKDFRKNLNRARAQNAYSIPFEAGKHEEIVQKIVLSWAMRHEGRYSLEDLTAPAQSVMSLAKQASLSVHGLIIYENESPAGFIFWEETKPETGQAASIWGTSISFFKGISEFTYFEMCRVLHERGYREVCIGGSEEAGLDAFKRKMMPEKSVELKTICL